MRMATKGPRTYRKQFPGRHVVALLVVDPGDTEILIEGPVSKELATKIVNLLVEERRQQVEQAAAAPSWKCGLAECLACEK